MLSAVESKEVKTSKARTKATIEIRIKMMPIINKRYPLNFFILLF